MKENDLLNLWNHIERLFEESRNYNEEVERMVCTMFYWKELAFIYGYGYVCWVVNCSDLWMEGCK